MLSSETFYDNFNQKLFLGLVRNSEWREAAHHPTDKFPSSFIGRCEALDVTITAVYKITRQDIDFRISYRRAKVIIEGAFGVTIGLDMSVQDIKESLICALSYRKLSGQHFGANGLVNEYVPGNVFTAGLKRGSEEDLDEFLTRTILYTS